MKLLVKPDCFICEGLTAWVKLNNFPELDVMSVPPNGRIAESAGAENFPCLVLDSGAVISQPQGRVDIIKILIEDYYGRAYN